MFFKQTTPVLFAICAFNSLFGLPAFAADLTIFSSPEGSRTAPATKQQGRIESEKRAHPLGRHSKAKREGKKKSPAIKGASKQRRGKITYHLFDGTRVKFRDDISSHTPFDIPFRGRRLGTGLNDTGLMVQSSEQPKPPLNTLSGIGQKADTTNSAGISSDCRGKSTPPIGTYRELTACYVHNHDKGWKTQTYLSKGFSSDRSSSSNWGGGLAVGFDY